MKYLLVLLLTFSLEAKAQKPEARMLQLMAYDATNKQILLFGGANNERLFKDLWCLKNSKWKKLSDDGPPGCIKSAFAYDVERKCAVLFGGAGDENKPLDETWEWDGVNWKKINIVGPPGRLHPMATYDRKNKVIIIFGGVGSIGLLSDTWAYDGKMWIQKNNDGPKNCLPHALFYDEKKEKVILITLSATSDPNATHVKNEMWEWDGKSWKNLSYGTVFTASGNLQACAGSGYGNIILLDGDDKLTNNCKTWKFSGNTWTGDTMQSPSARIGEGLIYDPSRDKTILFGGGNRKDIFNDLWEWNGSEWREIKQVSAQQ